ncbi:hypothetical protein B0T10DRAFT_604533 [Thelonectria olida]|uniref:Uncharacterized protein n=1 Tax=Thelonectria olida TaxID=1576542 RepID=A0A9P8WBQ5_9HYPO|nr:hypothetical protein B0T10DRAFT_604533 [Thelonectria olida]
MPPITTPQTGDMVGVMQQLRGSIGHRTSRTVLDALGDAHASLLESFSRNLPIAPASHSTSQLTDGHRLHRRDPTGNKIGLTIGVTFTFLFIVGGYLWHSRNGERPPREPRSKSRSTSDSNVGVNDDSHGAASYHFHENHESYRETVVSSRKKHSKRDRDRSHIDGRERRRHAQASYAVPEPMLPHPEPTYPGLGGGPNKMDAPQDDEMVSGGVFCAVELDDIREGRRKSHSKKKRRG